MALLDEHGVAVDCPEFVTADKLARWEHCVGIATKVTRLEPGHPEHTMFASTLFQSDIPTDAEPLEEAVVDPRKLSMIARLRRRNRLGRFADEPMRVRMPAPASSPGVQYTQEEIRAAGLHKEPEPGEPTKKLLGGALSTAELYSLGEPQPGVPVRVPYDDERAFLHNDILAHFFKGKTPPPGKPHAVFTAGGPSSGKTSVLDANPELLPPAEHTIHIDPDAIKEMLPEYQELRKAKDRYAAKAVHRESGDIAARMLLEAMEQGFHVVIDGTGDSGQGEFVKQLETVRGHDPETGESRYTVDLIYVNAPVEQAISWAISRAERTGRFVPVPVIRRQHAQVSRNFQNEVVDLPWLNSLEIIEMGERTATWRGGSLVVVNPARYAAFIAKADEVVEDGA